MTGPNRRGTPRYVVRMTLAGGSSTDLTSDLPWREARGALTMVRRIFGHPDARAEGWIASSMHHGFGASKGDVSVSFTVEDVGPIDLVGRAGAERRRGSERLSIEQRSG
ncbi:MAG: hypothetical protein WCB85_04410 [Candidatus Dormiibacterota bacterium]